MGGYVLALCNRTENMVRPWLEAGIPCVTVDTQEADRPHPLRTHVVSKVTDFVPFDVIPRARPSIVFAFPPCTDLAVSGARWFKDKGLRTLINALEVVEDCRSLCEGSQSPWLLENPIGILSSYWRQPDYSFHPVHYAGYAPDPEADGYTKKTCLWTGGGFVMPDRKPGEPTLGALIHRMPPSEDRADKRSVTPLGFAYAVYHANRHLLREAAA